MVADDLPCPNDILKRRPLNYWHVPVNRKFLYQIDGMVRAKRSQEGVYEGWSQVFVGGTVILRDLASNRTWLRPEHPTSEKIYIREVFNRMLGTTLLTDSHKCQAEMC